MSRHDNSRAPNKRTAAYEIAELLHRNGPMTIGAIASVIAFGSNYPSKRMALVQRRIDTGWFQMEGDKLALTPHAAAYMADMVESSEPKSKFIGIPATGCTFNMLTRPPYKTPRTYRREGPVWAQRPAGFGFVTIAGVAL